MAVAPLAGMIAGPLLQGAGVGAALGLGAGGLGALVSGGISLLQGDDPLTAGLNALGGYGGAGGIADLAKSGASAAGASANLNPTTFTSVAPNAAAAAESPGLTSWVDDLGAPLGQSSTPLTAPTTDFSFSNVGSGVKDLFSPGGMDRFKAATGSSALTSVGLPAAGMLLSTPPPAYGGEFSLDMGPFTPLSDVRKQQSGGGSQYSLYAEGGITDVSNMAMGGMFDARTHLPSFDEPKSTYRSGGYLDGPGDGMSDSIPATIADKQPARLADGEFVIPADVVSHLGNGSTKAGAQRLYGMMDKVRKARTGTTKQGRQINPNKYMPA